MRQHSGLKAGGAVLQRHQRTPGSRSARPPRRQHGVTGARGNREQDRLYARLGYLVRVAARRVNALASASAAPSAIDRVPALVA
jgi:hypothetical protein